MKGRNAFTLIELLLVIAVLAGFLAAVLALSPNTSAVDRKARAARLSAMFETIEASFSLYRETKGAYPASACPLPASLSSVCFPAFIPEYLFPVPSPKEVLSGAYQDFYFSDSPVSCVYIKLSSFTQEDWKVLLVLKDVLGDRITLSTSICSKEDLSSPLPTEAPSTSPFYVNFLLN